MAWYIGFKNNTNMVKIFNYDKPVTKKIFGKLFTNVGGPFKTENQARKAAKKDGWFLSSSTKLDIQTKRKNPPTATDIYDNILAIEAIKGKRSLWPNEKFRHDFKQGGKIIGLSDGSLLIKPKKDGKKLWKNFNY